MQTSLEAFVPRPNYAGKKVLLGLSGGINSAALLCWLAQAPDAEKPAELHLLSHQFAEHSGDTGPFIDACRAYAHQHFPCVVVDESDNSVLAFFEESKMIPHPRLAPCTRMLKLVPTMAYMARLGITHNVVGYVQSEQQRISKMEEKGEPTEFGVLLKDGVEAGFLIRHFTDAWCLNMVDRHIGWHPAIYDLRWNDSGFMAFLAPIITAYEAGNTGGLSPKDMRAIKKRFGKNIPVFEHNNCLPCKNMMLWQMLCVQYFYPLYWAAAKATEQAIAAGYWGRDEAAYYAQFGYHAAAEEAGAPCGVCALD